MRNKRQLQAERTTLDSMQEIVEAYEEIAAMRMRKVKKSVLQNREFISGLNNIFQRVWYTYQHTKKSTFAKNVEPVLVTNGKTLSILVAANTGLYGDIIKKTFKLFINSITGSDTDLLIIGKMGRQLFEELHNGLSYQYFEVSDSGQDRQSLQSMFEYMLKYTNIVVYHGLYVSVLTQNPVRTFVTGQALNIKESTNKNELKCLIEPTVEEVTAFFEKQILATIFEQSMFEASLSKFASRMMSLDVAGENILERIKSVKFQVLKYKHSLNNIKQQERISGIALWD